MKRKISNITLISSLAITAAFMIIIFFNLYTVFNKFTEKNNNALKQFYTQQQKQLIKNEVERLTSRIRTEKKTAMTFAREALKDKVASAEDFLINVYSNHNKSENEHVNAMIASFNWNHKKGYFYIFSENGILQYHGGDKELNGISSDKLTMKLPKLKQFLNEVYTKGEAYGIYDFYKPGDNTKTYLKFAYAKYNPKLKMLIGTGIYIDTIDEQVKQQILNSISSERFGFNNYGYFWIIDTDYNVIFHIDPELKSTDLYDYKDKDGNFVFRDVVSIAKTQGSGFTKYSWNIPGKTDSSDKISYISYMPEWKWIVASGFYFENYNTLVTNNRMISQQVLMNELTRNGIITCVMLLIITAISLVIYKKIRNIEQEQEIFVNDLLQYKEIIDESAIVSITDTKGNMIHVNDHMCEITGYSREELLGHRHSKLGHPDNPASTYKSLWASITAGKPWKGIIKNLTKDGGYFYQRSTIMPFKDKSGNIIRFIAISYDVTELFENKSQLQKYLHADPLTDLGNRACLLSDIHTAKSSSLAIIDIDGFHNINDTYGMKAGDRFLKLFAEKLEESIYLKQYNLYRLHSDVFAVLASQQEDNIFIINVQKAVKTFSKTIFNVENNELIVGIKTGFAHGSEHLLAHADSALQFAKTNNINHYTYDPMEAEINKVYEQNTKLVKMISDAIDSDRVVPFFQPIYGGEVDKYECLMRIINHDGSIIPPGDFIDISKQTRFYPILTRIIAKKSIDTFAGTNAEFSINFSSEDLLNSETTDFVYNYASEHNIMNRLIIEIVESESIASHSQATAALYKFKLAGAKIAIDDFGTGYSNFDYLLKIKADYIKIDGSIIKLITKDERAEDILSSIVSYARKLGMKTIAEFISDKSLADKALEMGVDLLQGYYIGKPEPKPVELKKAAI